MVLLLSCAVWVGLDRPLAAVTEPSLFGSVRTIASLSLLATDQPAGTGMVTPSFDSLLARLPMIASAVPHPAIKTTRATMAAMISTQGVRCTGGTGPVGM